MSHISTQFKLISNRTVRSSGVRKMSGVSTHVYDILAGDEIRIYFYEAQTKYQQTFFENFEINKLQQKFVDA